MDGKVYNMSKSTLLQVLQEQETGVRAQKDRAAAQMLRVLVNAEKTLKDSGINPYILLGMKNVIRQAKRAGITTKGSF